MAAQPFARALGPARLRRVHERAIVGKAAQVLGEVFRLLVAQSGIGRQAFADDAFQAAWNRWSQALLDLDALAALRGHQHDEVPQRSIAGVLLKRTFP